MLLNKNLRIIAFKHVLLHSITIYTHKTIVMSILINKQSIEKFKFNQYFSYFNQEFLPTNGLFSKDAMYH